MNVQEISDDWIMILTAMIKDCGHMVECPNVNRKRREIALPFRQERKNRGLKKISVFDDLKQRPNYYDLTKRPSPIPLSLGFDLTNMSDDEVKIWFAIGAEIMDYSMLGYGVRSYVESIWRESEEELDRRKIEPKFFCEMKM